MKPSRDHKGPVVIGGVGGSGTRVVAEILQQWGFYLGNDLNSASDNLLYTLLFKRPKWFSLNQKNRNGITTGISLFEKLMERNVRISPPELLFLLRAVVSMAVFGESAGGKGRFREALTRVYKLFVNNQMMTENVGWGWKEPNSHLILENLVDHFSSLKYIHTVRHGLDMAFSRNQQQLNNWGGLFGVQYPDVLSGLPSASLKYWIEANRRVLDIANQIGEERVLILDFDKLCISPETEISRLRDFVGIEIDENRYSESIGMPQIPESMGRYEMENLDQFETEDLEKLSEFGFTVFTTE